MTSLERTGRKFKLVFLCLTGFAVINVYLVHVLVYEDTAELNREDSSITRFPPTSRPTKEPRNYTAVVYQRILAITDKVNSFFKPSIFSKNYDNNFSSLLEIHPLPKGSDIWKIASKWVTNDNIVPSKAPLLPHVIKSLKEAAILDADVSSKGTQLKLSFTLDGGQKALFKPKWYDRDQVLVGKVYGGKDRHNGEISAFHLARLLGLHRVPIVAGRRVDLQAEILPVATTTLSRTFFKDGNNTCFYGVCTYCRSDDAVCGNRSILEGAIVLWLPNRFRLVKQRHPWQRSYSSSMAKWEVYGNYCSLVRQSKLFQGESQLLDLVETSVFDFLIDNGDRHHYERFAGSDKVLLVDNGKSFGNPYVDHFDILAPLFQCCKIRENIVSRLSELRGGALERWLGKLLSFETDISPVLNHHHMEALDRRLTLVLSTILVCVKDHGLRNVLIAE